MKRKITVTKEAAHMKSISLALAAVAIGLLVAAPARRASPGLSAPSDPALRSRSRRVAPRSPNSRPASMRSR